MFYFLAFKKGVLILCPNLGCMSDPLRRYNGETFSLV